MKASRCPRFPISLSFFPEPILPIILELFFSVSLIEETAFLLVIIFPTIRRVSVCHKAIGMLIYLNCFQFSSRYFPTGFPVVHLLHTITQFCFSMTITACPTIMQLQN